MTYKTDCTLPKELLEQIAQQGLDVLPDIIGVLCTFSERTIVSSDVEKRRSQPIDDLVFDPKIPKNISLENTNSNHIHIFDYGLTGAGSQEYKSLVLEVLARS